MSLARVRPQTTGRGPRRSSVGTRSARSRVIWPVRPEDYMQLTSSVGGQQRGRLSRCARPSTLFCNGIPHSKPPGSGFAGSPDCLTFTGVGDVALASRREPSVQESPPATRSAVLGKIIWTGRIGGRRGLRTACCFVKSAPLTASRLSASLG
jgi:hypothetical protein